LAHDPKFRRALAGAARYGAAVNRLFYGDNLDVLRQHVPSGSVDLVYLDPPFNSKKSYNVLFKGHAREDAAAQIEAFGDTWVWSPDTDVAYDELVMAAPTKVADAIAAMRAMLTENDVMAYLVMMAQRLLEIHRVLKPTGSMFLHCDPTASHYLKVLLDTIFGPTNFVNEIAWCYDTGGKGKKHFPRKHDVIFWYGKTAARYFNYDAVALPRDFSTMHEKIFTDPDGRSYQTNIKNGKEYRYYLDKGVLPLDWWADIQALNPSAKERLNYPTQKPVALLTRIINAACPPDGSVLDPFCGCGTTVDAAVRLDRKWIGIDITYIAIDVIKTRLIDTHGKSITATFETHGIPHDLESAQALFAQSALDFERWAVSLVGAQANEKQVGDKGIDGQSRFPLGGGQLGRILISVKGGTHLSPTMARDLEGTLSAQKADIGILITLAAPTKGVLEVINKGGTYTHPGSGQVYPRLQSYTIAELLGGKRPNTPATVLPYLTAPKMPAADQPSLFE
jgi:site-specific DNA-methyltransferase (adenine-specific)